MLPSSQATVSYLHNQQGVQLKGSMSIYRSIWIQWGIQYSKKLQNNNDHVQKWCTIIKEGSSTTLSCAKYSLINSLYKAFTSIFIFFTFSVILLWQMWNSFYCERGSEVTFPLFWTFISEKNLKRLERSNKVRIRTDFSFPACRLTVIGCHSHVCSSWRHFIWMYSLSSLLHQRAQEISLVWISSRIRSSPGSSRVSLGSSLPSYDYFAKNEPIPCPVCIFRSCSALLRPLPNNSDKHTFILGCERLCFSWLTV